MKLSIIILNYKSKGFTRECVRGILDSQLPFEFEIIVVDNASGDGVCQLINKRFAEVRCIENDRNLGMGAGNNVGMRAAKGEYLMILNPDTVLKRQSIVPLVEFLDSHSKVGIAAPMILNPDRTHQPTVHRFPKFLMPFYRRTPLGRTKKGREFLKEYTISADQLQQPKPVDWVFGPAFMIRKSIADKLGGYDERYFMFMEDTDLCRQIWHLGFEVWYVPQAVLVHYPHRASAHDLGLSSIRKKTTWIHISSWLKYFWKWRGK